MNNAKKAKTAYLFREIGTIDDRLLQEAISYRPQRILPRTLMIAASLALTVSLSFGAILIAMRQGSKNEAFDGEVGTPIDVTVNEFTLYSQSVAYTTVASAQQIDFFGGKAYVVWQGAEEETLCVSRALSESEVASLTREIPKGTPVGESPQALSYRVWIVMGDGNVVTPHLKPSDGNVGSAELFDYNAELIPSQAFNSQISEILN